MLLFAIGFAFATASPTFYDVLGPFSLGTRETGGDVVAVCGGISSIYSQFKASQQQPVLPSELSNDGYVRRFQRLTTNQQDGSIHFSFPNVDWNFMSQTGGPVALR